MMPEEDSSGNDRQAMELAGSSLSLKIGNVYDPPQFQ